MIDFETLKALTIPEGEVIKIERGNEVLWELMSAALPSEYQEVEWLRGETDVHTYIDLGFAFDTKCRVYMKQWLSTTTQTGYPFGAAESSGTKRCMVTCPTNSKAYFYGSNATTYIAATMDIVTDEPNEFSLILEEGHLRISNMAVEKSSSLSSQISYAMTNNLYLFAQNYNGSPRSGLARQIGYFQYWDKNDELICALVPCYRKSDGVVGMYDLVREIFLTNVGKGAFTAGPLVTTNKGWNLLDKIGYYDGYKLSATNGELYKAEGYVTLDFMTLTYGDIYRIQGIEIPKASDNSTYLCIYSKSTGEFISATLLYEGLSWNGMTFTVEDDGTVVIKTTNGLLLRFFVKAQTGKDIIITRNRAII